MNFRILLLLSALSLVLMRCSSSIPETDPVFDDHLSMEKRLQLALDENLLTEMGYPESFQLEVKDFYEDRHFEPVWTNDSTLNESGMLFSNFFRQSTCIGLPQSRLDKTVQKAWKHELVVKELLLTAKLSQTRHDLYAGIMDTSANKMKPLVACSSELISKMIQEKDTVSNWGYWFANMGPKHPEYRRMAAALFYQVYGKTISTKSFKIPELKKDSVNCMHLTKEALVEKNYLTSKEYPDTAFLSALMRFQEDHALKPDGIVGVYTRELLEESDQHQLDRVVLSLERWRWRSAFPDRYIWVNIPEYLLRIYYNDTLYSEHRVVVGKRENTTPQLTSKLRSIVAMPYWTQPQSIASKEFLPAIQANPNYAARNHYKVYRGETEVDPKTINWKKYKEKNFPFRIKQEPGDDNALGLIKFEFSNKYGVYIHDTPSKSFFNRDVRSFSHGCVRCQEPDSLAHIILRKDDKQTIIPDSLDSIIARKEHMIIALHKPITIQIDYITVGTDPKGRLVIHPDIYKRDEEYLKWMK